MANARQRGEKKEPEAIEEAVRQHIEEWGAAIGLRRTDAPFEQFREDVTGALRACREFHIAEQIPLFKKFTRTADLRWHLKDQARDARALAKQLRQFASRYRHPTLVLHPGRVFDLSAPAQDLDMLASLLLDCAAFCKDSGGQTHRTPAFDTLAEGLIRAYSRATKRKGTGGNVKEGRSRLRQLVEAVLPTARKIAEAATGNPLKVPARGGLGYRLDEIAKRLLKGAQPPRI